MLLSSLPPRKATPVGTAHKTLRKPQKPKLPTPSSAAVKSQEDINHEISLLPDLIKQKYTNWPGGAKDFQLAAIAAQVKGQDVLIHAATGSGKTGIAAAPHLLPSNKGKVTLIVAPILVLQDEQVKDHVLVFFRTG